MVSTGRLRRGDGDGIVAVSKQCEVPVIKVKGLVPVGEGEGLVLVIKVEGLGIEKNGTRDPLNGK